MQGGGVFNFAENVFTQMTQKRQIYTGLEFFATQRGGVFCFAENVFTQMTQKRQIYTDLEDFRDAKR